MYALVVYVYVCMCMCVCVRVCMCRYVCVYICLYMIPIYSDTCYLIYVYGGGKERESVRERSEESERDRQRQRETEGRQTERRPPSASETFQSVFRCASPKRALSRSWSMRFSSSLLYVTLPSFDSPACRRQACKRASVVVSVSARWFEANVVSSAGRCGRLGRVSLKAQPATESLERGASTG